MFLHVKKKKIGRPKIAWLVGKKMRQDKNNKHHSKQKKT